MSRFQYKNKNFIIKLACLIAAIAVLLFLLYLPAQTNVSRLYIFQTSDTHGHLNNAGTTEHGGWMQLGTVLKQQIKKTGGYKDCLIIDCGDTFQGSIEAAETKGACIIPILNYLKYDVFVPGNHDFDYGINNFLKRIKHINANVIAANLKTKISSLKPILSWKIFNRGGLKVAVIGMTSPYIKYWLWDNDINKYSVLSITDTLGRIMPEVLRAKPDIIVLAMHHGIYNSKRFLGKDTFLYDIIRKYPQIDLVLGGHTHQEYPGDVVYNSTLYVQPGCHAEYLAKIKIEKSKGEKPLIKSELIPISTKVKPDKKLVAINSEIIKRCKIKPDDVIGYTRRSITNKKGKLFAEAVLYSFAVDAVVCSPIASVCISKGDITYQDIFNICPYENKIIILTLNRSELEKILGEQADFKDKYKGRLYLYIRGSKQNEVACIGQNDLPALFKTKNKVKVAFTSYDIAGAGNRFPILQKIAQRADVHALDINCYLRDLLLRYIRKRFF